MKRKLIFIVLIILGAGGFVAVPFIVGIEPTLACLSRLGWSGITLFILISSLYMIVPAIGWKMFMHNAGHPVPLLSLVQANLMGFPLNYITPSLYLGGEPLKTIFIGNKHAVQKRRVLATIIVSKFQELLALAICIIAATFVMIWGTTLFTHTQQILIMSATGVIALALITVMLAFIGNFKPIVKVINLLIRFKIFALKLIDIRSKVEEIEEIIHASFVKHWKTFLLSQFITFFSALSIFFRPAVFLYFLNGGETTFSMTDLCVIFVLTQLVSIVQIVPGNLGIWEGSSIGIFSLIQRTEPEAAAFAIASRITDVVFLFLGIWLILHYGLSRVARETVVQRKSKYPIP